MRAASGKLLTVPGGAELEKRTTCSVRSVDARGVRQKLEEPVCERCFGTGMEVVAGKGARRCECRLGELRLRLFEQARVPRRHEQCTLSNYQPATENVSRMLAFKQAYRLVREY